MGALGGDVTELLRAWGDGDEGARDRLMPLVYKELRRRAAAYMRRERRNHTFQPTDLVHEAYLRMVDQRRTEWKNRAQFFGIASQMMRRILVDRARARRRDKRPLLADLRTEVTPRPDLYRDARTRWEAKHPRRGRGAGARCPSR